MQPTLALASQDSRMRRALSPQRKPFSSTFSMLKAVPLITGFTSQQGELRARQMLVYHPLTTITRAAITSGGSRHKPLTAMGEAGWMLVGGCRRMVH